ncbi:MULTISPECIES: hypothetical protein [Paenibacillus]|uniref:Uncharacterized protein n=1 Tax=Paenibacillus lignilyticus TaxID=1172615 RepID=A0ABS5C8M5_9BACL|nr:MULTISPECIES: hypothetical protein [Paenibacillus]MBP3962354.1 hypothetical protein [Paenibacillus lignilyticus]SFT02382.1 hypothetical protein SAMN05428962_3783 [Paenibacillus sp. BC26]
MALSRVRPKYYLPSSGKVIRTTVPKTLNETTTTGPTFSRLTVVWVAQNGVPFLTTGFFARLFRNNQVVATASFDSFGVVRFNNIGTLTNVTYTIRTFNSNGVLFRTRTIPSGVQTYAIIG